MTNERIDGCRPLPSLLEPNLASWGMWGLVGRERDGEGLASVGPTQPILGLAFLASPTSATLNTGPGASSGTSH